MRFGGGLAIAPVALAVLVVFDVGNDQQEGQTVQPALRTRTQAREQVEGRKAWGMGTGDHGDDAVVEHERLPGRLAIAFLDDGVVVGEPFPERRADHARAVNDE